MLGLNREQGSHPRIGKNKATMVNSETFLGLRLLNNNNINNIAKNQSRESSLNDVLNSITEILQNDSTAHLNYQDLYNKVYLICIAESPEKLLESIDARITAFFETYVNNSSCLKDFMAQYSILDTKLQKIDSLFIYLSRKIKTSFNSIYELALFKYKKYVLLNKNVFGFLEAEILREVTELRNLFQQVGNQADSSTLNSVLLLLQQNDLLAQDNLNKKIVTQFRQSFIEQLKAHPFDYNIYSYSNNLSEIHSKDIAFIGNIAIIDVKLKKVILNEFIDVFLTGIAPRLVSDEIFISNDEISLKLMINDQYIIDHIYLNETQELINKRYTAFLFHTLNSEVFQVNTSNINSKKDYLDLVGQLTDIIVCLYQRNIAFIDKNIISVDSRVNASLKLELNSFIKMIVNNDDKIHLGVENNQWFVVLIRYMDTFIHLHGNNDSDEVNLDVVTSIVCILDGLEEQRFEEFIKAYESLLSKRLMNENSNTIKLEYKIIKIMEANLNHQNGRNKEDITRMSHMVNDFIITKKLNKKFMEEAKLHDMQTDVKVLNQFFWSNLVDNENSKFSNLLIPKPLNDYLTKFEAFYQKNYEARQVKWLYQHWQIDVEHFLNGKTYLFTLPFITSIIFYHIINNEFVTIKSLKKMTGLPTKQIVQNLATLSIKYGVISHYDRDMKLSEEKSAIKDGDFFAINGDYVNDKDTIKVNVMTITKK